MGVLVDATTPARWTGVVNANTGGSVTSASFTAPAGALLVLTAEYDTANVWTAGTRTPSDTGGLPWTAAVEHLGSEATPGGGSGVWTAGTTSAVARTVTLALGAPTPSASGWGTGRVSCKLYVLTGADVSGTPVDAVTASNEGGSATNDLTTTSLTPGADGLLVVSDCDWNQLGVMTSSDLTLDSADYSGAISVASGYKACSSGVGVTADLNAGGTAAAQHKWCQIVVRAAAAADVLMGQACL